VTDLYIHGMGIFHPENIVDNQFLEELDIGTNNQWILDRVGIHERRTVLPLDYIKETKNADLRMAYEAQLYSNTDTARIAATKAMEMAGVKPEQIGMLISGSSSPDYVTPSGAGPIAAELGIEAPVFNMTTSCSSFGSHINLLSRMTVESLPEFVLIVLPENCSRFLDYSDRSTCVLMGDGTLAAVISAQHPSKYKVSQSFLNSSPQGWDKVVISRYGHLVQDGRAVQTFAIKRTVQCYKELQQKHPHSSPYFISHQANLRMLESVCKKAEVAADKHLFNINYYGNTASAGAPSVMVQNLDKFKAGDVIYLIVVGAGLTWSGMVIEVGE